MLTRRLRSGAPHPDGTAIPRSPAASGEEGSAASSSRSILSVMGQRQRFPIAHAFAALGQFTLVASAAAATPDLSGSWTFVPKRSDDVRAKIVDAAGIAYTQGDIKKDAPRAWIREWLIAQAAQPDAHILTVEQSPAEFKTGMGDEVHNYYFGRDTTRQGPGGGLRKATVRWQGEQIVVQERAEKGSGRIDEVYTLLPDGRTLVVAWRLEHKSLRQPLELKLVFEKTAP